MKVWDYQTKTCIQTLTGHEDNVSAVRFHPRLPYILSCGEDGRVLVFHSGSYRKERVLLQPVLDRCWAVALSEHGNTVVLGYDEGYCCYALGKAAPPVSMDLQGRLIWARRQELWLSVCEARPGVALKGEELALQSKEISWDVWGEGALTAAGPLRGDAVADPAQRERAVFGDRGRGRVRGVHESPAAQQGVRRGHRLRVAPQQQRVLRADRSVEVRV